ncbi:family 10 glycosylhydrolase [Nocardiopsis sediminis]|uniref:Family 10 glycosylhydrolase n=1 Tax=Nocardiopsis sediminis TaxID=1778267 RepID=A0ABV8FMS6_9ACTN
MGWRVRGAAAAAALPLLAGCFGAPSGEGSGSGDTAAQAQPGIPEDCEADPAFPKRQMRGAWLTTVRNIDWPSEPGLPADEQQEELRERLDAAQGLGLNTVFLHIRPTADAMYASELEPWARYLTGEQGGDPGYDPLEFAVAEAHERGLELHGWFNPYRVGFADPDLENLTDDHPARRNPEWLVEYGDEGYLDPGNPEVRAWVVGVVLDVVERYDIDGVHFDDYFYPYPAEGEEFDDDASWEAHGGDAENRDAWRRENIDALIAEVHSGIAETKPWVLFGVSPFGIWRNEDSDPEGSATGGLQSYDAQYADTREWIREETVDYIVPQLYWHRGFATADYEELVPWWADQVAGTGVDLYIGQAAYRVGEDDWEGADALSRQLDFNRDRPEVTGDVYFSMKDLSGRANAAMDRVVEDHYVRPALPPQADGAEGVPDPVGEVTAARDGDEVELRWDEVDGARSYAVYRVPGAGEDPCDLADAEHLVAVVGAGGEGTRTFTDTAPADGEARYQVTVLDAYRTESAPSPAARVAGAGE